VAILGKSPVWALLGIPSLGWMTLLGAAIMRGRPTVGTAETLRLDRMLIEVGGVDAFGVVATDQTNSPVIFRRGKQPRIYAATDFVHGASDDVLRGVAALQHAALADPLMQRRGKVLNIVRLVIGFTVALAAAAVAPAHTGPLAALATIGVSMWLPGAVLSARSRSKRAIADYEGLDHVAAQLARNPAAVADALLAMAAWRSARRKGHVLAENIAHRIITPVRPSWHEPERAAALAALIPGG